MSEQGTEKTNPLHGLERDGTGTGVWTHPAAEAKQPEQPERCECGACHWDADVDWWRWGDETDVSRSSDLPYLVAHCPGSCGCRLSVVDGEPVVEKQDRLPSGTVAGWLNIICWTVANLRERSMPVFQLGQLANDVRRMAEKHGCWMPGGDTDE